MYSSINPHAPCPAKLHADAHCSFYVLEIEARRVKSINAKKAMSWSDPTRESTARRMYCTVIKMSRCSKQDGGMIRILNDAKIKGRRRTGLKSFGLSVPGGS